MASVKSVNVETVANDDRGRGQRWTITYQKSLIEWILPTD